MVKVILNSTNNRGRIQTGGAKSRMVSRDDPNADREKQSDARHQRVDQSIPATPYG